MLPELSALEVRILGTLLEKQITTPDYYPMTLNGLTAGCNQKTARFPVTAYEENEILSGLDELRDKGLALRVDAAGSRVAKFRHQLENRFELDKAQYAILCVLLLRGPQTLGEIRTRSERLYLFRDLQQTQEVMNSLLKPPEDSEDEDETKFTYELPKEAGRKEKRYTHLLSGIPQPASLEENSQPVTENVAAARSALAEEVTVLKSRITELESEHAVLKETVQTLEAQFAEFKQQFE